MTGVARSLPRLLAVVGPTAAGKSAVALQLAQRFRVPIGACDSVQVYRGLDIGSAKPNRSERDAVEHYFLDLVDPDQDFSAGDYARLAYPICTTRNIVMCGGSGLYLRSLAYTQTGAQSSEDVSRTEPQRLDFERSWTHRESESPGAAHEELARVDPATAAQVHRNNVVRCIRSLWLCNLHGLPISQLRTNDPPRLRFDLLLLVVDPGQEALAAAIAQRCYRMITAGWVEEVVMLRRAGYHLAHKAMNSLGYRQIFEHLDGRCSLDEAVEAIVRETCHYARRQRTYLRSQFPGAQVLPITSGADLPTSRLAEFLQSSQGEPA
jgi:tRNA dimethylallyltransferase